MKWYQHLFWKIFIVVWGISSVATVVVFFALQGLSEHRQDLELLETRAKGQAQLLVERFDRGESLPRPEEFNKTLGRRWMPLWIYLHDSKSQILGPPLALQKHMHGMIRFTIAAPSGQRFDVLTPKPREGFYFKRITRYLLSVQMALLLLASALTSLLLSLIVVRPVNQLKQHARELYDGENLGSRTSQKLSGRKDELGELAREFNNMAAYVERVLTTQQRLTQDVSHELRAPLARLQVAVGLAEQRLGEGDKTAQRINYECERLNGLIGEILSLSRLEQTDPKGPAFKVNDLFEQLVADACFAAPERQIKMQVMPDTLALCANRTLLQKSLGNAVFNALKYSPQETPIEIAAELTATAVMLTVRDHGPGVDNDLLTRMREPFVRGSGGHGDGYGLGLSIAHRAVDRMGGELRLENHPQGGFILTVILPLSYRVQR